MATPGGLAAELDELRAWLHAHPAWWNIPARQLAALVPLVERFLFRVGS